MPAAEASPLRELGALRCGQVWLTLAATLNHSALDVANALGPWLAGLALTPGFGLPATGWVAGLGGLAVWAVSILVERRDHWSVWRSV